MYRSTLISKALLFASFLGFFLVAQTAFASYHAKCALQVKVNKVNGLSYKMHPNAPLKQRVTFTVAQVAAQEGGNGAECASYPQRVFTTTVSIPSSKMLKKLKAGSLMQIHVIHHFGLSRYGVYKFSSWKLQKVHAPSTKKNPNQV